jgi:hypothetical protein
MGDVLTPSCTISLIAQKNKRFEAGEAILEMIELQREFKMFSNEHSLYETFTLLDIKPSNPVERPIWRKWLDVYLQRYPSDIADINGHDRWVKAYQGNLEGEHPLPMYITRHLLSEDPRVLVRTGTPLLFVPVEHVIVSIPSVPARIESFD